MPWDALSTLSGAKWVIPDDSFVLFWENNLPLCAGLPALCALPLRRGSRCSEIHSQPYLSPKWIIPDGNSSRFEKIIYLFNPFLMCKAVCLWPTTIAARGLGAAWGPQKPEGCRCSDMNSQPYLSPKWIIPDEILPVLRKQFACFTV